MREIEEKIRQTIVYLLHHLIVLEIFVDRHIEAKVLQCVGKILAVYIRAGPKAEMEKRMFLEGSTKGNCKDFVALFFLPALQRRNIEVLLVEDECNSSLGMIHVVLGSESWCRHFGINSTVGSAAAG